MDRKLATILSADVVGYSAMMERNEEATFKRLRARCKEMLKPEIEKHRGRIFKLIGDGLSPALQVQEVLKCYPLGRYSVSDDPRFWEHGDQRVEQGIVAALNGT